MDKQELRKHFTKKRNDLPEEQRRLGEKALCDRIISLPCFRDCDTLLLYSPTKNEPDLLALAEYALKNGKRVAFPRSNKNDFTLSFGCVSSLGEMVVGAYSISEPPVNAENAVLSKNTLCIVPALAVDAEGFRLGYGKGYYDRFLSDFHGVSLGAVFDGFVAERLPRLDTDIPLDLVITQTGVIKAL